MSDFTPNTRVALAARPGVTGTFERYYAPLPSGTRNVAVRWDDATLSTLIVHESQVVAIESKES
ncbi:putative elongation factor [Mycolicibacterium phage Vic9]